MAPAQAALASRWRLYGTGSVMQTDVVQRARRHQRFSSALAFALLALSAELLGRSLAHRLDVGRHVASPSYAGADYYPFLLAAVKLGVALLLARLAWRFVRARSSAGAARRGLAAVGKTPTPAPRVGSSSRHNSGWRRSSSPRS